MSSARKQLNAAVVGLGIGEQHVIAFNNHPRTNLHSVFDFDTAKSQLIADRYRCARADSFQSIVANPEIDVVAIATFDDAHFMEVVQCLNARKHVFVEKPICRTVDELRQIKHAWNRHDGRIKLHSNLILRAAPVYAKIRSMIASGEFGEVYSFDGDYLYGRIHKLTEGWRKDVEDYSVMEGGGIHLLDLMLWLTGQRPTSVVAAGNRACTAGTAFRYNDFVSAMFEFDSGMIGRISANFGCVHRHHHVMRIFGTNRTFIYDDAGPRLHTTRDPDESAERMGLSPLPAHKGDLIPGFIDAITDQSDDRMITQSFFDAVSICAAADKSAALGERVGIDYV